MTPIVCFDIDGVIATGTAAEVYSDEAGWAYERCQAIKSTVKLIWDLHNQGVHIILYTARLNADKKKTEEWLFEQGVVYDELIVGKPFAHVYIDDRNFPAPFDPHSEGIRSALISRLKELCPEGCKSLK